LNVQRLRLFAGIAALAVYELSAGSAAAQSFAASAQPGLGGAGSTVANPNANPFANPYLNPFLNPYMTMYPQNRTDTMLFFWSAQQARSGPGAAGPTMVLPGMGPGFGMPGNAGTALGQGSGPGSSAPAASGGQGRARQGARGTGQRFEPSQPRSGGHVAGRFAEYPAFNNRDRLSRRYPAFGSMAVNSETGSQVAPGMSPAPNQGPPGCFNHYPSYNRNNGR
jgi:hypothetical protein